jgi:hypothetical protein
MACDGHSRAGTPNHYGRRTEGVAGWASHTVRGFLAGLAKKGIQVGVLERVRQIDSDNRGAKGSYTVYRVADTSKQ